MFQRVTICLLILLIGVAICALRWRPRRSRPVPATSTPWGPVGLAGGPGHLDRRGLSLPAGDPGEVRLAADYRGTRQAGTERRRPDRPGRGGQPEGQGHPGRVRAQAGRRPGAGSRRPRAGPPRRRAARPRRWSTRRRRTPRRNSGGPSSKSTPPPPRPSKSWPTTARRWPSSWPARSSHAKLNPRDHAQLIEQAVAGFVAGRRRTTNETAGPKPHHRSAPHG